MTAQVAEPDPARWRIDPEALANATSETLPYAGPSAPPSAREHAWAARLQEALLGMDAEDPAGLDQWMARHAAAAQPHVAEAELVAAWDTLIRDTYGDQGTFDHWAQVQHDQAHAHDHDDAHGL
jgi:hypothetical protein